MGNSRTPTTQQQHTQQPWRGWQREGGGPRWRATARLSISSIGPNVIPTAVIIGYCSRVSKRRSPPHIDTAPPTHRSLCFANHNRRHAGRPGQRSASPSGAAGRSSSRKSSSRRRRAPIGLAGRPAGRGVGAGGGGVRSPPPSKFRSTLAAWSRVPLSDLASPPIKFR